MREAKKDRHKNIHFGNILCGLLTICPKKYLLYLVFNFYFQILSLKLIKVGKKYRTSNIQRFLRSFSGTGTRTKCRSRHKTYTDWKGPVNTGLKKVMMRTFLCRYWIAWFLSVPVLCRNRHFVLVPVPLKDRKKRCMIVKNPFFKIEPITGKLSCHALLQISNRK